MAKKELTREDNVFQLNNDGFVAQIPDGSFVLMLSVDGKEFYPYKTSQDDLESSRITGPDVLTAKGGIPGTFIKIDGIQRENITVVY